MKSQFTHLGVSAEMTEMPTTLRMGDDTRVELAPPYKEEFAKTSFMAFWRLTPLPLISISWLLTLSVMQKSVRSALFCQE